MKQQNNSALDDSEDDLDEFEAEEDTTDRVNKKNIYHLYQMEGLKALREIRHIALILARKIEVETEQQVQMSKLMGQNPLSVFNPPTFIPNTPVQGKT